MRKIFVALLLISFLAGLAVPAISSAETSNCCKIKRSFKFQGVPWGTGNYPCVGEVADKCVAADGSTLCANTSADLTTSTDAWGTICILNSVYKIVDIVFFLLIVVAVLVGLAGAYNILTAGGAAEKVNKGRDLIIYAIIGVVVAFFARAIPSIIAMVL